MEQIVHSQGCRIQTRHHTGAFHRRELTKILQNGTPPQEAGTPDKHRAGTPPLRALQRPRKRFHSGLRQTHPPAVAHLRRQTAGSNSRRHQGHRLLPLRHKLLKRAGFPLYFIYNLDISVNHVVTHLTEIGSKHSVGLSKNDLEHAGREQESRLQP